MEAIQITASENIIAAFHYMILRLALQYVENRDSSLINEQITKKIEIFNASNDFSTRKCDVFPFLVTTGNGHIIELLSFFNNQFVIVKHGQQKIKINGGDISNHSIFDAVVQKDIHSYLESNNSKQRKLITINDYFSTIDIQLLGVHPNIEGLQQFIIGHFQVHNQQNELIKIFKSIDESATHINKNRLRNFANLDYEILSAWTKRNSAYRLFQPYFESDGTPQANDEEVITIFNRIISTSEFELQPS